MSMFRLKHQAILRGQNLLRVLSYDIAAAVYYIRLTARAAVAAGRLSLDREVKGHCKKSADPKKLGQDNLGNESSWGSE